MEQNKSQTAIILHGVFEVGNRDYFENGERIKNSPSNSHWMPWLQKELRDLMVFQK